MSIMSTFDAVVGALAVATTPALAVVLFTVAVRLLISPLTYLQVRGEHRRSALAPQIKELQEKHKDDPLALVTETLALQRSAGAGPMVSLLPALAQAPFFLLMYKVTVGGRLDGVLWGVPLTAHLTSGWPVFLALLAVAALLAWWTSHRMRRLNAESPRWLTFLPYFTIPAVAVMPLAGALYLVTSTAWTALEHAIWRRPANR